MFRQAVFVLSPFVVAAVSDERIGSRRTKALAWLNWSLAESLKSGLAGLSTMAFNSWRCCSMAQLSAGSKSETLTLSKAGTAAATQTVTKAERRAEAKAKGYEGEMCGECGNFTLVRNGTCMKCDTCGSTTGCS